MKRVKGTGRGGERDKRKREEKERGEREDTKRRRKETSFSVLPFPHSHTSFPLSVLMTRDSERSHLFPRIILSTSDEAFCTHTHTHITGQTQGLVIEKNNLEKSDGI